MMTGTPASARYGRFAALCGWGQAHARTNEPPASLRVCKVGPRHRRDPGPGPRRDHACHASPVGHAGIGGCRTRADTVPRPGIVILALADISLNQTITGLN